MNMLEKYGGEKVHTRNISIATYAGDGDDITVEGILKDDRLTDHYTISGEIHPPNVVHHMIVRIRVNGATLAIDDIEVEMPGIPHEECIETRNSLDALVGLAIAPGFTSKVKKAVGGVKGCVHMTTLLLSMAPAALQGYWANHARKSALERPSEEVLDMYLVDTCKVWRRNGPLARSLTEKAD